MNNPWPLVITIVVLVCILIALMAISMNSLIDENKSLTMQFEALKNEYQELVKEYECLYSKVLALESATSDVTEKIFYEPAEGYENIDALAPEDVVNLKEFERAACMIAQTIYGEARGSDLYNKSLVAWCIFNRYDDGRFGDTIEEIITKPGQFTGYSSNKPITDEDYKLAVDCLLRWQAEKYSLGDVGRTLPKEYLYFYGDGKLNHYRTSKGGKTYSYNLPNPYSK